VLTSQGFAVNRVTRTAADHLSKSLLSLFLVQNPKRILKQEISITWKMDTFPMGMLIMLCTVIVSWLLSKSKTSLTILTSADYKLT
jgi:L-lactate permease